MLQSETPPPIGTDEDYERLEKAAGIKSPNHAFRHGVAKSEDASRLLEDIASPSVDEKEAWAYDYAIMELGLEGSGFVAD
jgi:hypothetical protein